ncbi:MAG: DUF4350 domain-containing protein [Candidatus Thiodiazotropha sp. (ex Lucinoma kastoroae)]|nr:DUF4350 domain-containing protein [Candidatus Thiodiazotropha sp. (ex Lucinoma kastoroae)]
MRDNRLGIAVGLTLLILLCGFFTLWFVENFERHSKQIHSGMTTEARRNPLLAAEYYLSRLEIDVTSHAGRQFLAEPPQRPGLLLVRDLGPPLPQARVASLLAWVESGGHLLVTPGTLLEDGPVHPLLEQFGVAIVSRESTEDEDEDEDEDEEISTLFLPDESASTQIKFDNNKWFDVESEQAHWAAPDEDYPQLLIFPWGEGRVTFLSDSDFFSNDRIGEHDHALLLARLVGDSNPVWLLYSSQMPSLLSLLWRHAPYLLITLALLVLLMIWRLSQRSGPLILPTSRQRRDLLEHLQAAAEFAWRHDPSAGLFERGRLVVEKRWLASHPLLHHLDEEARCQWLAEKTGMTAHSIHQALYPHQGDTGHLIKTMTNLQRLLSALHPEKREH